MHIQLKPALRTLWRGADSVQIGLSSPRGTVIDGLIAQDARVVEQLRTGIDPAGLDLSSPGHATRHRQLIKLLDDAGVLLVRAFTGSPGEAARHQVPSAERLAPDAALWSLVHPRSGDGWPLLAQRAAQRVVIAGASRLGGLLASTLSSAGVGQVCVVDGGRVQTADLGPGAARATDLGRPRQDAAADAVLRAGGRASTALTLAEAALGGEPGPPPGSSAEPAHRPGDEPTTDGRPADLVVLIGYGAADASAADDLVTNDIAHLSVVVREDDIVVGPMVRPGRAPCLRCLDLHRADRDPAWPSIVAQLADESVLGEETATAVLAAGLASLQVLAHLDGFMIPATVGATLEIEPPDGLVARREWPAHPSCGCHWPLRATSPGVTSSVMTATAGEPAAESKSLSEQRAGE